MTRLLTPGDPAIATVPRLEWPLLPPLLRDWVEARCGAPVVAAETRDIGFTPGMAAVLTCADDTRHFVKAASTRAQPASAASYRDELRATAALAGLLPELGAPALRFSLDEDWVVLGYEYVDGAPPSRPWQRGDVDRCLDALAGYAVPTAPDALSSFADEHAGLPALWSTVRRERPDLVHAPRAAELALAFADHLTGDAVVHSEPRSDNFLLGPAGVRLCDWTWPSRGPRWADAVLLLAEAYADGLDAEEVLASRPELAAAPAEAVDALLALVAGFHLRSSLLPAPSPSPGLRPYQAVQGEACLDWLARRRHW